MPENPNPLPIPKLLLTAPEAAEALSVCPRTLWELTHSGEIPVVRIGRLVRYDVRALQRWIDEKAAGAVAGA
jgi:excisionase family DNA binding protein